MKLLIPISINIFYVIGIYLAEKHTRFKNLPYMAKQVIIGIIFGLNACFASSYGVELLGTVANVRDAAPISAGLIFGAPAGIIAGFIGGIYRWFSIYWGGGMFTRVACTLATILAGFLAAALRKFMFDNKKPTWTYAIAITMLCEVIHMLLIIWTNMSDSVYAFEFVRGVTIPMMLGNVVAVGFALISVSILSKEGIRKKSENENIAETFQRWLLLCVIVAYAVTGFFTYNLQSQMTDINTQNVFKSAINDVTLDVRGKSDIYLLDIVETIKKEYEENPEISLDDLAQKHGVVEINIVDRSGMIIDSTDPSVIDKFDMNSTEQSKEFMVLNKGEYSYVQEYGPIGNDPNVMRKYAGIVLATGGFIQVGYTRDQFNVILDEFIVDVTKNRHVGTGGFIAVCNESFELITSDDFNGKHISSIGISPNEEMLAGTSSSQLYTTDIVFEADNFNEQYMYVFTFIEGYCVIAAMPESEVTLMRDSAVYVSLFMQVIVFATLFVFIYILIKKVIINNLKKINNTLGQITEGNLNVTVDVRSNEEFASLSDDINSTVSTLKRYIAEAAARIDKELEYAKQIQLSVLPANYPDNDNYSINAQMIAAKEVGGDFYDFYELNSNTIAFLVADVSGKGIPAAMFMMTAKTIIKDLAERGLAVNDILTQANEKLCENNESGMFVTAWMGILDIKSGKLQYSNAGHNPPVLKHADGSIEYLRTRAGFVLAGMDGVKYRVNELELKGGDRIFLYTDGVTEATNLNNQLYGEDRLIEFMSKNADLNGGELLPALKADIDLFVGEAPQFDDITMLVLDYNKKGGVSMTNRTFPASIDALDDVISHTEQTLESYDCSMKNTMAICVAIEEVFVNIAHYAYGDEEGNVDYSISFDEGSRDVTFVMKDKGIPFDPLKKPDPDITLSAEERSIGGLGIYITKNTMDKVEYAYENGENIMTMIKKI